MRRPIVVADDFNRDGRVDLAVFDAGVYVVEESLGYGKSAAVVPERSGRTPSALGDEQQAEGRLMFDVRFRTCERP